MKNKEILKSILSLKSGLKGSVIFCIILWGIGYIFLGGLLLDKRAVIFSIVYFIFAIIFFIFVFPMLKMNLYERQKYFIPIYKINNELLDKIGDSLIKLGFNAQFKGDKLLIIGINENICYKIIFNREDNYFIILADRKNNSFLGLKNWHKYYRYLRDIPFLVAYIQNLAIEDFNDYYSYKKPNKPIGSFKRQFKRLAVIFLVLFFYVLAYFIAMVMLLNMDIKRYEKGIEKSQIESLKD